MVEHLSQLRREQLKQFEEMNILEIRVSCRILPKSINDLDRFMPPHPANDGSMYEIVKKHQKSIRDLEQQLLLKQLEEYESLIEEKEFRYQEIIFDLELQLSDETQNDLMASIYHYLHCQTMNQIRSIR